MKDVVIIGGGASGIAAAIYAALNGHKVTILEQNNKCGKKILITGNGHCNYFNSNMDVKYYHTDNIKLLEKIITKENCTEILDFFNSLGIVPKIKNNCFYPYSNQASSVLNALTTKVKNLNIEVITDYYVKDIKKEENFIINNDIKAKYVIIACGGKSYPKTGSDGSGYILANLLGHKINVPLPSLVKLIGKGLFLKKWAGIRCEGIISLYEDGKFIKKECGELQLTDYGISGICTFNLSYYISKGLIHNKKEELLINFAPFTSNIHNFLSSKKDLTISQILDGFLNYKLGNIILEMCEINKDDYFYNLKENKKILLEKTLTSFPLLITKTKSFDEAQVTTGGVSFKEINEKMQSKLVKNLSFAGEIIDVDGICGGYNLGFAFISGMIAGKNIKDDDNA